MNGLKAFGIGLGATAGMIVGVYAGVKLIEAAGYLHAKSDMAREKDFNKELDMRIEEALKAAGISSKASAVV